MENKILMPRLGVNDDYVKLVRFLVKNGQKIEPSTKIASIETAKETSEIISPFGGYIYFSESEGNDVAVSAAIAVVSDEERDISSTSSNNDTSGLEITKKAKALIKEYSIDISLLPKKGLIKEKDVLALIEKPYSVQDVQTNKVIIYGDGRGSKIVYDVLESSHVFEIEGIVGTGYYEGKIISGVPVLGADDILPVLQKKGINKVINSINFVNGKHYRKPIYEKLKNMGFEFANAIHHDAVIGKNVKFGEGNIVCAGAVIGIDVRIGSNCMINANSTISHDCTISDHCHIASGAVIAGGVTIGENTLIGQNCSVYMDVKIGKNVIIQNGCSITRNIKDNEIVFNN